MFQTKNSKHILRADNYPQPDGSRLTLLRFPLLEQTGVVKHCFTTRRGGVSSGSLSSLNLSFSRGDDENAVRENFHRIALALEVKEEKFVFTDQTHTTNVRRVTGEDAGKGLMRKPDYTDVDGLITNEPGIVLSAFFADCVPLYFVDPVHKSIGLSHSGWRGTVHRMGKVTIEAMKKEFGTNPADLICAVGPSVCGGCYEVGEEVAEAFGKAFVGREQEIITPVKESGKFMLDLWRANEIVLTEAGVCENKIAVTNICTCCNASLLFSHRASMGRRGNLGAFLSLS